jgi:drug/metabolite transporter (DMT)-like permease
MWILFYAIAVLVWGTDAAITKRYLLSSIAPAPMLTIRLAVAGLTLLPFGMMELRTLKAFRKKEWAYLAVLILIGTLVMNLLYYESLRRIPAYITLILFRLDSVFIIIISVLFLRQKTDWRTVLLTLAALVSAGAISLGNQSSLAFKELNGLGIGLVLLASLASGLSTIVAKDLLKVISPILLVTLRTSLTSVCLLAWQGPALFRDILPSIPGSDLWLMIFMGAVFSGVTFWVYYKGLKYTTPLVGSLVQLLRVVSGLGASYLLLAEAPTTIQWLGMAGLMGALFFLTQPKPAHTHS